MYYFLNLKNSSPGRFKNRKIISKKFWIFLVSCFFILFFFIFFSPKIIAAQLTNQSTTISDSRPSMSNVTYNYQWEGSSPDVLRCIIIKSCTSSTGSCTTPTGMQTTSASKGTFTGFTSGNWTLDTATNGTLKLTNIAGEAPGANISLVLSGIKNPSSSGSFATRIYTYSNSSCTADVDFARSRFDILSGISITATVIAQPTTAEIIFKGKGSPGAFVTILRGGAIVGTTQILTNGSFSKKITAVSPGISVFGIYGKDSKGRDTRTIFYTLNLAAGTSTTVSGVFLSPTISLSTNQVYKGENITISGTTYPSSTVTTFLSPGNKLFTIKAGINGRWSYSLNTDNFGKGTYNLIARALSPLGEYSDFSKELSFDIFAISERECKGADLNLDGEINIIDFSILLYFWGQRNPINNCANINDSDTVDLIDFSIMMYYWTE
ncbi:MAG: hypothetical protein PHI88_00790 [Candidatus Pacebacteria bacterium]|nr:hypothetical protein [Candidatus Paceibacterota bacterium]